MGVTATVVGGAALLGGAYLGSRAAKKAAKTQAEGTMSAAQLELQGTREGIEYQTGAEARARKDISPWRKKGVMALDKLYGLMETGPGKFEESPGYQFRKAEGLKAIERSAAARGGVFSGRGLKDIIRFGQDYASNEYDNFLNRYFNKLRPWQSLSGIGQTSAGGMADITTRTGQGVSNLAMIGGRSAGEGVRGAAGARASGYINSANAWTNAINQGVGTGAYMYGTGKWG